MHEEVAAIVTNPAAFVDDPLRGEFARALLNAPPPLRAEPVKYHQWGEGLPEWLGFYKQILHESDYEAWLRESARSRGRSPYP